MNWEENKEFTESKVNVQPDPPEPFSIVRKIWIYVLVGIICFLFGLSIPQSRANKVAQRNRDLNNKLEELQNRPAETVLVNVPAPPVTESIPAAKEAAPVADVPETETIDYTNNDYYDTIEVSSFKNSIGETIVIQKVFAKKNVTAVATHIAYDSDGNVIGKSSDKIVLSSGMRNFFRFSFDSDISESNVVMKLQVRTDDAMTGERFGVEMVDYNQNEDYLYITFKQHAEELKYFEKFKLLFYKDDKIVETEYGYFSSYTKDLNGKDSTDVAKIWVYGIDYDYFECIYEP